MLSIKHRFDLYYLSKWLIKYVTKKEKFLLYNIHNKNEILQNN